MMKRFFAVFVCFLFLAGSSYGGEIRTLPSPIDLVSNTTDKYEALTLVFYYGSSPYAEIKYNILDDNGRVYRNHTLQVRNIADDPDTPEDETSTAFTDFVTGYASIIYNRSGALMETDISTNYP